MPEPNDPEVLSYKLLRELTEKPEVSQRGLAVRFGVSLGKVNYCLGALVSKGWVKVGNFRRHDKKWAYAYLLTPSGVAAKFRLTRDFLARKEREFELLRSEIQQLRGECASASRPAKRDKVKGKDREAKTKAGQ